MIVVDASAMIELLLDTELGRRIDARVLAASARHAPHLMDVEVVSVLRRFVLAKMLTSQRAAEAIEDLVAFPLQRHPHTGLIDRVFELRANLTAYDAVYLALAEAIGAPLVTCDEALLKTPDRRTVVELVR